MENNTFRSMSERMRGWATDEKPFDSDDIYDLLTLFELTERMSFSSYEKKYEVTIAQNNPQFIHCCFCRHEIWDNREPSLLRHSSFSGVCVKCASKLFCMDNLDEKPPVLIAEIFDDGLLDMSFDKLDEFLDENAYYRAEHHGYFRFIEHVIKNEERIIGKHYLLSAEDIYEKYGLLLCELKYAAENSIIPMWNLPIHNSLFFKSKLDLTKAQTKEIRENVLITEKEAIVQIPAIDSQYFRGMVRSHGLQKVTMTHPAGQNLYRLSDIMKIVESGEYKPRKQARKNP